MSIGVSYFAFQAISYLTDVYLEIEEPERHLGYYALYLAFFPKLLQGPIERAGDLLPQLKRGYVCDPERLRRALLQLVWGLFQKIVIADRLGSYVDAVFNDIHAYSGWPLLAATYLFALQIYFDFSGYTEMALGSAQLFGIDLTQNFNAPYRATSIADFWRRWHISFSRWILDYIFKPLQLAWRGGKKAGTAAALLVTFFVSGLWHGISWGFVIWGGLHGIYLACATFYGPYQKRLHRAMGLDKGTLLTVWQRGVTFHLVCFAWIFFRANSVADAWYLVTHVVDFARGSGLHTTIEPTRDLLITLLLLLVPFAVSLFRCRLPLLEQRGWVRWSAYYALALGIMLFRNAGESFIYFRF
ncbi:MBOAT family O-acyltransferase [Geomesophilobacter sediminis]|uniref:MBOAT family protein n=1 Tax=Geomesophilobacter sediminis TaxID=2798584 RepID=A0A8J7JGK6_9BACT|nr:MBOAT family O-acyltransferase [Geomesophilobacter sediminis]MBJ6725949.1 MBOAT family protein [Geomesophilobacter sediminis]